METKYLRFMNYPDPSRKTELWEIYSKSNDALLGEIKWYGAWKQYCFFPLNALFNSTCLDDIKKFLDKLNEEHRAKK